MAQGFKHCDRNFSFFWGLQALLSFMNRENPP
jgi:hypothetical protein